MSKKLQTVPPTLSPCDYTIEDTLGSGVFGEVLLASRKNDPECLVALKRISKGHKKFDWKMVHREIEAGKRLNAGKQFDGVIKYMEHFETVNNIYIVMEYIEGHDLFSYMEARDFRPVRDRNARVIFTQVVEALQQCHETGVSHRDVKLDNILITKDMKTTLIDFGLCSITNNEEQKFCSDFVGSPEYAAPEILLRKPYDGFKADVWSCGVLLYALLYGCFPFPSNRQWVQLTQIGEHPPIDWADAKPHFPCVVSPLAKDLITKMLHKTPADRLKLADILKHPWVTNNRPIEVHES